MFISCVDSMENQIRSNQVKGRALIEGIDCTGDRRPKNPNRDSWEPPRDY